MDKKDKILSAKKQLSVAWKCCVTDFESDKNVFIETQDIFFQMVSFGNNAVIRADKKMVEWCFKNFELTPASLIMDSDNFYLINEKLRYYGKKLGEENIRYLHLLPQKVIEKPLNFSYKRYDQDNVNELYKYKGFENSLEYNGREVLAIAAYDGEKIAAVGGVDNHLGGSIWQIGIDTVSEYRGYGLGAYLVKELAIETERQEKVSCYTTWSANIASTRLALSAGFSPVWLEYSSDNL
ncbi:MAG: GNAT family N-acetyltransferase [Defluviitaleaceae bacterium]|nr:GNAT family N-acetyltransferase [Defluviitaleaceae bacterium]